MKKIILFIILLINFPLVYGNGYAIIHDPDGYVNLRKREDFESNAIIGKVYNDSPVACEDEITPNSRFCYIKTEGKSGFVHKDRLLFLDESSKFEKLKLIQKSKTSASFKNSHAKLFVSVKHDQLKKSDYSTNIDRFGNRVYLFKGKDFFGTDGEPVSSIYRFSNISLKLGNKLLTVPQSDFSQAFIPEYSINSGEIFQNLYAYINPKDNHAYIFSLLADGAALYTIVFEFRSDKYYRKYIWSEAI